MYKRIASILLTALLIPGLLGIAPASAENRPSPAIATYNVFLLPKALYPNWGQDKRADLIADDGVVADQDVVVFQELFENTSGDRLRAAVSEKYPHGTPVVGRSRSGWDTTTGYRPETTTNGGVSIHSVWPITRQEQHIFPRACGSDWFSNKGFAYVEIDSPHGTLHVLGTHMQSEDRGCTSGQDARIRSRQLAQIRSFLDGKDIPDDEQVYLAGDLNIIGGTAEYDQAIETLDAVAPTFTGAEYSWDPTTNSVAEGQYPGWAPQHLDYVLPIRNGAAPQAYRNETRAVKSEPWTVRSWGRDYTYDDYSDHYPVFGGAV
ncbi:sphingomyelin phosphodiesterase [Nocardiopsis mwathae]|uniref:Sphingomyelin phosphodiesterase n=1 Tax=Nocardiopsis mwathae TaxID=1472723 RepID=A0A7X0D3D9_9ACTN|nr:sphingomyelin phosphodiesterase [Nocardiopsis mwathae]MBB6170072.1 sphingomyelin phosphodiesterase [Nocardiopsis mwathae]